MGIYILLSTHGDVSHHSKTSLTIRKTMHRSSVILIVCVTISFSLGSDTIDLTQNFLQNTLDSLNEVDQNQNRNESTSGSVVIKTFRNAIKTLIEESKNSVKQKLEFIDKVDKKQSVNKVKNATSGNWDFTIGKWNITGNWNSSTGGYWNSNPGNNSLTRIFETVFDEDFGDYDEFETIFGEAIPKIDELIDGPLVPFFAIGLTLVMVMFALPFLMMTSMMIFIPFLMTFTIPFLMIGPIIAPLMLALEAV